VTFSPIYVYFSPTTVRKSDGVAIHGEGTAHSGDHWTIGRGGLVRVTFYADGPGDEVTLKIRALVSKLGERRGSSPLSVSLNGHSVLSEFIVSGGGDLPQNLPFAVNGDWLVKGENRLELRTGAEASSMFWLYQVLLESVQDRGAAERALNERNVTQPALTYATQLRSPESDDWRDGPPLTLYIDNQKAALPAKLSWGCADGSEADISLALELTTFLGHFRSGAGERLFYRGDLREQSEEPGGTVRNFETQVSWGSLTEWNQAERLAFCLECGHSPLGHLRWSDRRGNSASIGFPENGETFAGYRQNADEGPVAFQGQLIHG
jgi:hypothetical protein